jgi:hypothetical protein
VSEFVLWRARPLAFLVGENLTTKETTTMWQHVKKTLVIALISAGTTAIIFRVLPANARNVIVGAK